MASDRELAWGLAGGAGLAIAGTWLLATAGHGKSLLSVDFLQGRVHVKSPSGAVFLGGLEGIPAPFEARLRDFVTEPGSSCMLISGPRGSGKTWNVHHVSWALNLLPEDAAHFTPDRHSKQCASQGK